MARFAAAKDRLDVMLFVVMSMSPVLQQYGPLDDKQEGLGRAAAAAQKQPPLNASPPANAVFVNGALAVPGTPTNTDTVPAKFSAKNAADGELITIAYTFKTLTDEERRAIYQALKDQPAGSVFNAAIGTKLPPGIELRPVPEEVAARVPQTRDYRYAVGMDRVLLVGTNRIVHQCEDDGHCRPQSKVSRPPPPFPSNRWWAASAARAPRAATRPPRCRAA